MNDILTEEQYNAALKEANTLMKRGVENLTQTEFKYLQNLTECIEQYEDTQAYGFVQKYLDDEDYE